MFVADSNATAVRQFMDGIGVPADVTIEEFVESHDIGMLEQFVSQQPDTTVVNSSVISRLQNTVISS